MVLSSSTFHSKSLYDARTLGLRDARVAVFQHPLGGLTEDQVEERAARMYQSLQSELGRAPDSSAPPPAPAVGRLLAPTDPAELQAWFFDKHWSDGFPVIPPTAEAVKKMVAGSRRKGDDVIGIMPPRGGIASVELIAVNAVMSGCRPEHMPVLLTAVQAMLEPCFNLATLQATTHSVSPLLIVHGPITHELKMNSGAGAFGPSSMANAVIGRAIRLMLLNIGGAWPGEVDRSTHGAPSKYSFCIAENIEASPWGSFITDRGLPAGTNAVTVFGAEPPHNVNDHMHGDAESILHIAADVLRAMGHNNWYIAWNGRKEMMLILGPEHAASIAASGWSRRQVREYLHRAVSRRRDELGRGGMYGMHDWPAAWDALPPDAMISAVPSPDDMLVLVAGGAGKHSVALPTFGATVSVTRPIPAQ